MLEIIDNLTLFPILFLGFCVLTWYIFGDIDMRYVINKGLSIGNKIRKFIDGMGFNILSGLIIIINNMLIKQIVVILDFIINIMKGFVGYDINHQDENIQTDDIDENINIDRHDEDIQTDDIDENINIDRHDKDIQTDVDDISTDDKIEINYDNDFDLSDYFKLSDVDKDINAIYSDEVDDNKPIYHDIVDNIQCVESPKQVSEEEHRGDKIIDNILDEFDKKKDEIEHDVEEEKREAKEIKIKIGKRGNKVRIVTQ